MKFLVDECLSPTYVTELGRRGYLDAVHPIHIGMLGVRDDQIVARALLEDRIVVTANASDYRRLLARMPIHPGVIIVDPRTRGQSWRLVDIALDFIELQSQLEGTENRINIARRDYNEAVRDYNTELRTFPGVLWAGTLYKSSKPMQPFAATADAQAAPKVSFSAPASK